MAVKSIIQIDLDDAAFKKFKEDYDAFITHTGKRPIVPGIPGIPGSGGGTVPDWINKIPGIWHQAENSTRVIARNIAAATTALLRWSSITGLATGFLGFGSLYGLDRLAVSAGNQRRLALGLGATPGEIRGFGATYGRVVDPGQFLGSVNAALTDVTKRVGLYGAGLTEGDIRGRDTGQVAAGLIPALKRIADQTPTQLLAQVLSARHLDQFIGLEDFQRLKNTPLSEIESYQRQYQANRRQLELTQQQQKAWQDLQVQLHFAGLSIEQTFIRGLTPLAPQLAKLSKSFSDLVDAFLKSPTVKVWIDEAAAGLEHLSKFIGTPQFKQDVESFASGLGRMVSAIAGFVSWLTGKPSGGGDTQSPAGPRPPLHLFTGPNPLFPGPWTDPHPQYGPTFNPAAPNGIPRTGPLFGPQHTAFRPGDFGGGSRAQEAHDFFRLAGWSEAQTAGLLANINAESGFNPRAVNASGHQGIAQWDAARSAQFRRLFGHDPAQGTFEEQLLFAQWELTHSEKAAGDRLRAYGRTPESSAAIVNEGYERSGTNSAGRAGAAGSYMQQFKDRSVQVHIQNNTGGNATVSVAQLAT